MNCRLVERRAGIEADRVEPHTGASRRRGPDGAQRRCPHGAWRPDTDGAPRPRALRLRLSWRRLPWWGELLTIATFYVLYELVRGLTPSDAVLAARHADDIISAERWTHIQVELSLNRALSSVHVLAAMAATYYTTLHFIVTPLMLVYLWRWRPARYAELRSALVLTSVIALVVFWTWPVAPPRFALNGTSDTLVKVHLIGAANPHGIVSLINQYAAMPSLHVGWAVWCALAIVRTSRSRWRHLAWLYPTATSLVVVSTANHYVLDVVAGALLAAACLALTSWHGSTTGLPRSPIAPPVSKSQPVRSAAGTRGEPASTGSSEPAPSDDFQPVR